MWYVGGDSERVVRVYAEWLAAEPSGGITLHNLVRYKAASRSPMHKLISAIALRVPINFAEIFIASAWLKRKFSVRMATALS